VTFPEANHAEATPVDREREREQASDGRRPGQTERVGETPNALGAEELRLLDAYWRAANFLSVGQIYLLDNPLLREALTP
jgi:hypothetical protein